MEDALVPLLLRPHGCEVVSLNPCFNGRCTSTSVAKAIVTETKEES